MIWTGFSNVSCLVPFADMEPISWHRPTSSTIFTRRAGMGLNPLSRSFSVYRKAASRFWSGTDIRGLELPPNSLPTMSTTTCSKPSITSRQRASSIET